MEESISITVTDKQEVGLTLGDIETRKPDLQNMNGKDNQPVEDIDKEEIGRDNPYAYLDRADFTSEKFKIEIRGLPKFYGIGVRFASLLLVQINFLQSVVCDSCAGYVSCVCNESFPLAWAFIVCIANASIVQVSQHGTRYFSG
jgi:hypothetical protein